MSQVLLILAHFFHSNHPRLGKSQVAHVSVAVKRPQIALDNHIFKLSRIMVLDLTFPASDVPCPLFIFSQMVKYRNKGGRKNFR